MRPTWWCRQGQWTACVEVVADHRVRPSSPATGAASRSSGPSPPSGWPSGAQQVPQVETDHDGLADVIARSAEDLGALRIFDPEYPERVVVAAGRPVVHDRLRARLAAHRVDGPARRPRPGPRGAADPGPLPGHRHRPRPRGAARADPPRDALRRGGLAVARRRQHLLRHGRRHARCSSCCWASCAAGASPAKQVDELLPNAERALEWIERVRRRRRRRLRRVPAGHRPGPGQPGLEGLLGRHPLRRRPGGHGPHRPVRGAGLRLRRLPGPGPLRPRGGRRGAPSTASAPRPPTLKAAFNRDFWLEDKGLVRRRPRRATSGRSTRSPRTSATACGPGIVDDDKAQAVARHLVGPEMFTGWGVRTLASSMGGYNPVSYHCGSVWPHDTAIVAAGLARYGFEEAAQRLVMSLLDAGHGPRRPAPRALQRPRPHRLSASRWATRPRARPRRGRRRRRCCACAPCCGSTPGSPTARPGWRRWSPPRSARCGSRGSRWPDPGSTSRWSTGRSAVEGMPDGIELVEEPRHPLTAV